MLQGLLFTFLFLCCYFMWRMLQFSSQVELLAESGGRAVLRKGSRSVGIFRAALWSCFGIAAGLC